MYDRISKGGTCKYYTTESTDKFTESASVFLHERVEAEKVTL
jgi:glutamate racemase